MYKPDQSLTNTTDIKMCKFIAEEINYNKRLMPISELIKPEVNEAINRAVGNESLTKRDFRALLNAYCKLSSQIKNKTVSTNYHQLKGATTC